MASIMTQLKRDSPVVYPSQSSDLFVSYNAELWKASELIKNTELVSTMEYFYIKDITKASR